MERITGICNQCGLCCYIGRYKCENLEVTGFIGMANATRCKVYEKRFNNMPIILKTPEGEVMHGYCLKGVKEEDDIIAQYIRTGQCSMKEELYG